MIPEFVIDSREKAYFLGFLWADGCLPKTGHTQNEIRISIASEDMELIFPIFEKTGIKWRVTSYQPKNVKWKQKTTIFFCDAQLKKFLIQHNYQSKSESNASIIAVIPEAFRPYFFLGWFDGDGHISSDVEHNRFHIGFYAPIAQDWESLEKICEQLGVQFSIYRRERTRGASSEFRITGQDGMSKFLEFLPSKFGLSRKSEKIEAFKVFLANKKPKSSAYKGVSKNVARNKWTASFYGFPSERAAIEFHRQALPIARSLGIV